MPTSTKPKPSAEQRVRHLAVLVEAGGEAERVREIEAEHPAPQTWIGRQRETRDKAGCDRAQRQAVGPFRVEREEEEGAGGRSRS